MAQRYFKSQYNIPENPQDYVTSLENMLSQSQRELSATQERYRQQERTITNQNIALLEKDKVIADYKRENKRQQQIIAVQKKVIENERTQLNWHRGMLRNPLVSSHEKEVMTGYFDDMLPKKTREDGSRYYSVFQIAQLIGDTNGKKMQKVSPVHSKMQKYGIITTIKEKQKGDPTKQNNYDIISPQFWDHPETLKLDDHNEWGGKRIAVHKDCGGKCYDRTVYLCEKCGEDYIEQKDVIFYTEEEYANYESLIAQADKHIAELDVLAEEYSNIIPLSEIPREEDRSDIESFQMSMKAAKGAKRRQPYALEYGTPLGIQEMTFDANTGRSPPTLK